MQTLLPCLLDPLPWAAAEEGVGVEVVGVEVAVLPLREAEAESPSCNPAGAEQAGAGEASVAG